MDNNIVLVPTQYVLLHIGDAYNKSVKIIQIKKRTSPSSMIVWENVMEERIRIEITVPKYHYGFKPGIFEANILFQTYCGEMQREKIELLNNKTHDSVSSEVSKWKLRII